MRDTLGDTGVVPSPGYPYSSPDLIGYDPVAPSQVQAFFSSNYDSDVNKPIQLGSRMNPLYVRGKNLATTTKTGQYISVYRANTSLFLTPSRWAPNRLATQSGAGSVALPEMAPGAIGVGPEPFLIDGTVGQGLYCLVGMVTSTPNPVLPPDFASYSDYIAWVRNNQNVCGRNLSVLSSFPARAFERWDTFSNPEENAVPVLFMVTVNGPQGLPSGTTFGITCNPIGVQASWTWNPSSPSQTASSMCPKTWSGTAVTWATLPSGAVWPRGTTIGTKVYVGRDADDPVAIYATPWDELPVGPGDVDGVEDGVLVLLGTVTTQLAAS
ncbi:MAG TPA: hypothetical protein VFR97_11640 [Capillimicrobium sp.]|nr:hypothetical protein [Capillimicrobium sp.]